MSKNKNTIVGPRTVRAWAHANEGVVKGITISRTVKGETVESPADLSCLFAGPQGTGRGRLSKPVVAAFLAANKGTVYAEKTDAVKTISLPLVSPKTGRPIKPVSVPMTEFRRLSGTSKGKPSAAALSAAALAYQAQRA